MKDRILRLLAGTPQRMSPARLARELGCGASERSRLAKALKDLEALGLVQRVRDGYALPPRSQVETGVFSPAAGGYGFVAFKDAGREDLFIPPRYTAGALRGDTVEVLTTDKGRRGKPEGRVVRIVRKASTRRIGIYRERLGQPFFQPLDAPAKEDLPIASRGGLAPAQGMIVEVERDRMALARVLGDPDAPGVDVETVLRKYDLAADFPPDALEEAAAALDVRAPDDTLGREDFTGWPSVTIDGETAQDFDDAVSARDLGGGRVLVGVHIADVSHYVRPGSALDRAARDRATSVYLPGRTLPMLPERLSNDLCSLRPNRPRLAFSVLMELDAEGAVLSAAFKPSLIRTEARMTYDSVFRILEGDADERRRFAPLVPHLERLREAAAALRRRRLAEGSLDFDLIEPELVYSEGKLAAVVAAERNEAHELIEDLMVAANVAVATRVAEGGHPALFRVHPPPARADLEKLREILTSFGLEIPPAARATVRDLQKVLRAAERRPEAKVINFLVLRALRIAVYSAANAGHYGLAKRNYAHFTSPIRRYPDLVVHRVLRRALAGEKRKAADLEALALHCSERERRADEAERDLVLWRIFRFLRGKLGEEAEGLVVDMNRAGLVVALTEYFVEGLIAYPDLDGDYYVRRPDARLVGRRHKRVFRLGERIRVQIVAVDPVLRRIQLVLMAKEVPAR
jgi:ribonuclease R